MNWKNLFSKGNTKAYKTIAAFVFNALAMIELSLTPHTTPYVIIGTVLAAGAVLGVYVVPNPAKPASGMPTSDAKMN